MEKNYRFEKQTLIELLLFTLIKKIKKAGSKKTQITENSFHHYEVKLSLSGARIKHHVTPNEPPTFYIARIHMIFQITLVIIFI